MCLPHRAACRHTLCKRTDHPIIIHLKVGGACAARFFELAHACIILHQMAACGHCMPDRTDRPIIECPQTPSLSICVLPITTFGHERKLGCPPAPPFFQWLASWQHVGKVKSAYVCKLGGSPSTLLSSKLCVRCRTKQHVGTAKSPQQIAGFWISVSTVLYNQLFQQK